MSEPCDAQDLLKDVKRLKTAVGSGEKGTLCLLEEELGVAAGHLASSHPEPARE